VTAIGRGTDVTVIIEITVTTEVDASLFRDVDGDLHTAAYLTVNSYSSNSWSNRSNLWLGDILSATGLKSELLG